MVDETKHSEIKRRLASKKWLFSLTSLGLTFIIIPIILMFVNPIVYLANYIIKPPQQLRIANGSLVHKLLQKEIESAKIYVYLFNITNSERFLAGDDDALKVKEVGPFVYLEYRKNDDLEIDVEPGIMRYTPNLHSELVVEESFARPEDVYLVLPNIALLSTLQLLNKYPYFIKQLFKMLTTSMDLRPMVRVDVYTYLWNNTDPLITLVNSVVPGLIYFKSTGLMTRFYDVNAKYRLTVGTTNAEKLQVKTVERSQDNNNTMIAKTFIENTKFYTNTYEGAAFPPQMTPDMPIKIYRYSICKTFNIKYSRSRNTEYSSEAFVYNFDNSTFSGSKLCVSKGWCPKGVMDVSSCYLGFPFGITKGHFLDTEPKMFEKIQGLKPNRRLHDASFIIDPKIGVTLEAYISAQLNLVLGSMDMLRETTPLSNIFLPITHTVIKHPRMLEETKISLRLLYHYGPYILVSAQAVFAILGVGLLTCSARMMYWNRVDRGFEKTGFGDQCSNISPLLDRITR